LNLSNQTWGSNLLRQKEHFAEEMIATKVLEFVNNAKDGRILILGGSNTGKTSVSFRLAYEAAECGGCPIFICNQAKLELKLPLDVQYSSSNSTEPIRFAGMSADILSRIQMKYVTSMNELKAVISGLHAFVPSPTLVIIDDFSLLIDPLHSVPRSDPKFLDIALGMGAYTDDVLNFLGSRQISSEGAKLRLVITDSCEESAYIHVLQRTVNCVAKMVVSAGGDCQSLMCTGIGTSTGGNAVTGTGSSRGKQAEKGQLILSRIELAQGALHVTL
jgi:hypothetical protein